MRALGSIVVCSVLLVGWTTSRATAQTTITVDALGAQNYLVNGQPDPTLTVVRGTTYAFVVNTSGHPFNIQTQPGIGPNRQYNTGVTNNGVEIGTLTFAVPLDAPSQLFYQCGVHSQMQGAINVVNASASGAPAGTTSSALALCSLLCVIAILRLKARREPRSSDLPASRHR